MSGFLGNPIAEGIYSEVGVLYTSIFLIPMRIVMWSVGHDVLRRERDGGQAQGRQKRADAPLSGRHLFRTALHDHAGAAPSVVLNTVKYIGSCNSALTMFIVGTILVDVPLKSICNRDTAAFSVLRLVAPARGGAGRRDAAAP